MKIIISRDVAMCWWVNFREVGAIHYIEGNVNRREVWFKNIDKKQNLNLPKLLNIKNL